MTWMITATGRDFHLSGAASLGNQIDLADIAHALAQINRYTGHTTRPYSVAEHSLLVADIAQRAGATPMVQLAALLHDAHEAYTGDVSSPVKWALGNAWTEFETSMERAVRRHFNLQSVFASQGHLIKHYDLVALATERRDLTAFDPARNAPWGVLQGIEPADWVSLNSARALANWAEWCNLFVARYVDLQTQIRHWVRDNLQQAAADLQGAAQ